jgi:hypothetical protein
MAVFEFGKFITQIGRAISGIFGADTAPLPPTNSEYTMAGASQKKIYKDAKNKTVIGLANPTLNPPRMGMSATDYANSTITFDTTSYIDRALVSVENTGSASITINGFSIRGQQVVRLSGLNGLKWEYFNRRDIDTNGEKEFKVSSNFITNGDQCADIGDYIRKELEPHDMYSLTLKGVHPYFEVGDRSELVLDYKLPTMQFPTEQIAVDVEIRGVSIHRSVGSIGETMLSVRVPSGEWNNTTPTKARWIASGRMDQEQNRSNVLTIGAYDYAGTADIYCDGVDDDVEIQAAIDQLTLEGGGTVRLSRGHFILNTYIQIKNGITVTGEGRGTALNPQSATIGSIIYASLADGETCAASHLTIDGEGQLVTHTGSMGGIIYGDSNYKTTDFVLTNIHIKNYSINISSVYIIYRVKSISGCSVYSVSTTGDIRIYYNISIALGNTAHDITLTGTGATGIYIYQTIDLSSSCESYGCISGGWLVGSYYCNNISSCKHSGHIADDYAGFLFSKNISICESTDNSGSGSELGFSDCKSLQQCHTDDAIKYNNSYADSGSSNACADTYQGGFNS